MLFLLPSYFTLFMFLKVKKTTHSIGEGHLSLVTVVKRETMIDCIHINCH